MECVLIKVVNIFVDWLYTGKCPETNGGWEAANEALNARAGVKIELAALQAYAFGDRMMAREFQTAPRMFLVQRFADGQDVAFYDTVIFAFANLPADDILLKVLVDAHCQEYNVDDDGLHKGEMELRSQLPHEFLLRVMLRYSALRQSSSDDGLNPCDYHEHKSEKERKACKKKDNIEGDSDNDSAGAEDDEQNEDDEV